MKNPVHPGLLVKECLNDLGWTVAEAAAALISLVPKLLLGDADF
jgi:plasmid maintenance system antidote protein VapI